MNGDYSALAQAFQRPKMGGQRNGGIVPPHMQQPRPMGQMPGGVPGPGGIMDGQPRPQFGQFAGNIPRPMGGGIMGGQPQAPRPFQQPMGRRPF
jgi:hypothetical protein